jgi:TRAP-type C4-dicarboxylate transport system permease small subunit
MNPLEKAADRMAGWLALLGTLGLAAIVINVTADIVSRNLFAVAVPATIEMVSRYYMPLVAFLPLAWVERRNEMISVVIFSQHFGPGALRWMDGFVALLSTGTYALICYATWIDAVKNYETGTFVLSLTTALAVWPTYFILPLGFALATLVCLQRAFALISGRAEHAPGDDKAAS